LRQPQARLFAMICLTMAVSAAALTVSPWRTTTVGAVLFVVAGGDDSLGIRDDRPVVEKDIDMVLGRQQGADVALQHEVRAVGALDCLGDLGVGGVDQIPDLAADGLLPVGQGIDVGVHARVGGVRHSGIHPSSVVERVSGSW